MLQDEIAMSVLDRIIEAADCSSVSALQLQIGINLKSKLLHVFYLVNTYLASQKTNISSTCSDFHIISFVRQKNWRKWQTNFNLGQNMCIEQCAQIIGVAHKNWFTIEYKRNWVGKRIRWFINKDDFDE